MKKNLIDKTEYRLRCSNCGRINIYSKEEVDAVFPYSREKLICHFCFHPLSVCSWFVETKRFHQKIFKPELINKRGLSKHQKKR